MLVELFFFSSFYKIFKQRELFRPCLFQQTVHITGLGSHCPFGNCSFSELNSWIAQSSVISSQCLAGVYLVKLCWSEIGRPLCLAFGCSEPVAPEFIYICQGLREPQVAVWLEEFICLGLYISLRKWYL